MTENKRFMLDDAGELIDLNNHKFVDYGEECCNLLNELHEENQQCKEYNAKLYSNSMKSEKQLLKQIKELKEENKELRSDRDYWKTLAQSLARTNGNVELKDEHLAWKRVDVE